jgi:ABC-type bacteriocin/lantibiotic exporter with double-glycine peptidase domain
MIINVVFIALCAMWAYSGELNWYVLLILILLKLETAVLSKSIKNN